jgi:hypothetical protein
MSVFHNAGISPCRWHVIIKALTAFGIYSLSNLEYFTPTSSELLIDVE